MLCVLLRNLKERAPSSLPSLKVDAGRELPGPSASQLHLSRISLSNLSSRTRGAFFSASIPSLNITNLPSLPISSHKPFLLPSSLLGGVSAKVRVDAYVSSAELQYSPREKEGRRLRWKSS